MAKIKSCLTTVSFGTLILEIWNLKLTCPITESVTEFIFLFFKTIRGHSPWIWKCNLFWNRASNTISIQLGSYGSIYEQTIYAPKIGFMAPWSIKWNRVRMEESEEKTMNITLIGGKGWVVKSPIAEIIGGAIAIPLLNWKIECNLHPMSLCFKITILGWSSSTRIRVNRYSRSHQKCSHTDAKKWSSNTSVKQPPPSVVAVNAFLFHLLLAPPLFHCISLENLSRRSEVLQVSFCQKWKPSNTCEPSHNHAEDKDYTFWFETNKFDMREPGGGVCGRHGTCKENS